MSNLMNAEFDGTQRTLQEIARNGKNFGHFNGKIGSYGTVFQAQTEAPLGHNQQIKSIK